MKRILWAMGIAAILSTTSGMADERQLTFSPKGHHLDNNDNFSPDGKFLVYDTRETVGPGIQHGQTIEKVNIATGAETLLYKPKTIVMGDRPAPGIGAASFSPVANEVIFIHGPLVEEMDERGPYGLNNRNAASVPGDGSGTLRWIDKRDIARDRPTTPGAHRGGTHRHEYTLDGKRIGFTYDDFLCPQYERTIGYMEPRADAPAPASHYFALLVRPAEKGKSKPGEIERCAGDSWIGREGKMRAFIGKVRNDDGETYEESLFVVDIPDDVDITTADAGDATHYPTPPKGLKIRRLTHTWASGILRGTQDGKRIAYLAKAPDGITQVFVIPSDGSDKDPNKGPVQLTSLPQGVEGGIRWSPSGDRVYCISNNGIVSTVSQPGDANFGKSTFLTPEGDASPDKGNVTGQRGHLVLSQDGKLLAYGKYVETKDAAGKVVKNYDGQDFMQIFVLEVPADL